jgi:hypothetical protein
MALRALAAAALMIAARTSWAQPKPSESVPAETPSELSAQIKRVTDYLVEVQTWKKNAASGKLSPDRARRVKDAEAWYRAQHDLLLELMSRLRLWAHLADRLDRDHPRLTDSEVARVRGRQMDALKEY